MTSGADILQPGSNPAPYVSSRQGNFRVAVPICVGSTRAIAVLHNRRPPILPPNACTRRTCRSTHAVSRRGSGSTVLIKAIQERRDGNIRPALQQSGAVTPLSATTIKNAEASLGDPRFEKVCE